MNRKNTGTAESPDAALRQLLAEAIRQSGKKRPQIAEEMSPFVGVTVTQHMLNDFTAQKKSAARFPAAFIRAFCQVVGSSAPQRFLCDEEALTLIKLGEHVRECKPILTQIGALVDRLAMAQTSAKKGKRGRR
jgi:hypothetical protein